MENVNKLTIEELKMLAEMERRMDDGDVPFVKVGGHRLAMSREGMSHFGLQQGQTIDSTMCSAIMEYNLARCSAELEARRNPN